MEGKLGKSREKVLCVRQTGYKSFKAGESGHYTLSCVAGKFCEVENICDYKIKKVTVINIKDQPHLNNKAVENCNNRIAFFIGVNCVSCEL